MTYRKDFLRELAAASQTMQISAPMSSVSVAIPSYLESPDGKRVASPEVFDNQPRVLIVGAAGSGKAVMLRRYVADAARRYLSRQAGMLCPIFISGNQLPQLFNRTGGGVVLVNGSQSVDATAVREILESGRVKLIVDGIDEIGHHADAVHKLVTLLTAYPALTCVLSSRPTVNLNGFHILQRYVVSPFDRSQALSFIEQLSGPSDSGRAFLSALAQQPKLLEMSRQPLMLAMLWHRYERASVLPTDLARTLSDIVDTFINRWNAKRAFPNTLTINERLEVLGEIAVRIYVSDRIDIGPNEIGAAVAAVVLRQVDRDDLWRDVATTGLLIEVAEQRFSFIHRLFLTYFVARRLRDDAIGLLSLLDDHQWDRGELLELACGLADDVKALVQGCLSRGWLIEAASCVSAGRTRDKSLVDIVASRIGDAIGDRVARRLTQVWPRETAVSIADRTAERIESDLLTILDAASDMTVPNHVRGARFEAFAERMFSGLFKVVFKDYRTENGELDLILENLGHSPFWLEFGGDVLVECKNLTNRAPTHDIGHFLNKVTQARVKLAFILSDSGFTADAERALRNHASNPALALVVPITGRAIRAALETRDDLEEFLKDAIRAIKYLRY